MLIKRKPFIGLSFFVAVLILLAAHAFAMGPYNSRGGSTADPAREIIRDSSDSLSKTQVTGTIINNYGQTDLFNKQELPEAVEGLVFDAVVGADPADGVFAIQAALSDKIYLDGSAGEDHGFVATTPVVGTVIHFIAFQTGASSYDWAATSGSGTWEGELRWAYEDGDTMLMEDSDYHAVE